MFWLTPSDYNEEVDVVEPWNSIDTTTDSDILLDFYRLQPMHAQRKIGKMTSLKYPLEENM